MPVFKLAKGDTPTKDDVDWFVKNVGPRIYGNMLTIEGQGWCFEFLRYQDSDTGSWALHLRCEKTFMHWVLSR
jgi:hypothetical protein